MSSFFEVINKTSGTYIYNEHVIITYIYYCLPDLAELKV